MRYVDLMILVNLKSERDAKRALIKHCVVTALLFLAGSLFLFIGKELFTYQDFVAAADLFMAAFFGCVAWIFKMRCVELEETIAFYEGKKEEVNV